MSDYITIEHFLKLARLGQKFQNLNERFDKIEGLIAENKPAPAQLPKKYNLKEAADYCGMAESTFRTYKSQRDEVR